MARFLARAPEIRKGFAASSRPETGMTGMRQRNARPLPYTLAWAIRRPILTSPS
ncbi:hypothetical protein M2352_000914 [Azospirillum fermentarium]|nr:hypothetical protein [Azospirillum fermentarium]